MDGLRNIEVLGLIPARGGSKGIPGKNVKSLAGKPLISYTFESAILSRQLSRRVLSTDSVEIAEIGRRHNIDVPFMRPPELSADHSAAVDYVRHCLSYLRLREAYIPDFIVLLQPTCPLRTAEDIDKCIEMLHQSDADSVVSVAALPTKYHPNWQFTVSTNGELNPYLNGGWENLAAARQHLETTYTRNGAVYVFRRSTFETYNTIYGLKVLAYPMPENRSINIDEPFDWENAEKAMNNKIN